MKTAARTAVARKPRADAERNRDRLLLAAKSAFSRDGAGVSLDEIARSAGVGIGTLYRHFPTREAIVEAVYRREVRQIAEDAARLAATHAPVEALREWMRLFVSYMATKKIIAPALSSLTGGTSELFAHSGALIKKALSLLVDRAIASGDIRPDIDRMDLLYALVGVVNVNNGPDWQSIARRVIDILIAGVRR
jgi:AcrR family transcriptional regulator